MIASACLLLGVLIGGFGARHFLLKKQRWVMALTYSEASLVAIEQLHQLDQKNIDQAQRGLLRSLVIYAQESEKLTKVDDDAAWAAKKTLKYIEPFKVNAVYVQEEQEAKKPFHPEPLLAR